MWAQETKDVTKFAFKFDNIQTLLFSADSKFVKIFQVPIIEFELKMYTIGIMFKPEQQMCVA